MRRFEDVWYKRTEEGMEVYIADIKEFFVDNGGYVEQYKNVKDVYKRQEVKCIK